MMTTLAKFGLIAWVLAVVSLPPLQGQSRPLTDHHQHLFSPATSSRASGIKPVSAEDLIGFLDEAGIRRAVVLSVAYQLGNPNRPPETDEYAKVRAENDWTSQEVARFRDRLRGFCGVNPLKEYALQEIARCARDPQLHFGLKLHFGIQTSTSKTHGTSPHYARYFASRTPIAWRFWYTCDRR